MYSIDVLMITYNRPEYTYRSLERLLSTCDDSVRVWIWQNGSHGETLEVAQSYASHSRVANFHHSSENKKLREPTNWLWSNARGDFLSKVDDDCLVQPGWTRTLAQAHLAYDRFGVLGSWRFLDDEYVPELSEPKIADFPEGHRVLRNLWVQGSGYLMKRQCVLEQGLLRPGQSFSRYCIELGARGYVNGWYYPFVREEHMDDPRSPYTCLKTDEDLLNNLPLSAGPRSIRSLQDWEAQLRRSARRAQAASLDVRDHRGWRLKRRNGARRMHGWWESASKR